MKSIPEADLARLRVVPLTLKEANSFVAKIHRHHGPVLGHRFSLGAQRGDVLCGVAIVGRPVARGLDQRMAVEVTRLATDGTRNACSFLYRAACRAAWALGFLRVYTYTLAEESGSSLRGAGFTAEETTKGGGWSCASRPRNEQAVMFGKARQEGQKVRWVAMRHE